MICQWLPGEIHYWYKEWESALPPPLPPRPLPHWQWQPGISVALGKCHQCGGTLPSQTSPWQSCLPTSALHHFGTGCGLDSHLQASLKIRQWLFLPCWSCFWFRDWCSRALTAMLGLADYGVPSRYAAHLLTQLCPGRRFVTVRKWKD